MVGTVFFCTVTSKGGTFAICVSLVGTVFFCIVTSKGGMFAAGVSLVGTVFFCTVTSKGGMFAAGVSLVGTVSWTGGVGTGLAPVLVSTVLCVPGVLYVIAGISWMVPVVSRIVTVASLGRVLVTS